MYNDELIDWTGVIFAYTSNPAPKPGELIWLKRKQWGWYA
jgi:hypothetical protein